MYTYGCFETMKTSHMQKIQGYERLETIETKVNIIILDRQGSV